MQAQEIERREQPELAQPEPELDGSELRHPQFRCSQQEDPSQERLRQKCARSRSPVLSSLPVAGPKVVRPSSADPCDDAPRRSRLSKMGQPIDLPSDRCQSVDLQGQTAPIRRLPPPKHSAAEDCVHEHQCQDVDASGSTFHADNSYQLDPLCLTFDGELNRGDECASPPAEQRSPRFGFGGATGEAADAGGSADAKHSLEALVDLLEARRSGIASTSCLRDALRGPVPSVTPRGGSLRVPVAPGRAALLAANNARARDDAWAPSIGCPHSSSHRLRLLQQTGSLVGPAGFTVAASGRALHTQCVCRSLSPRAGRPSLRTPSQARADQRSPTPRGSCDERAPPCTSATFIAPLPLRVVLKTNAGTQKMFLNVVDTQGSLHAID